MTSHAIWVDEIAWVMISSIPLITLKEKIKTILIFLSFDTGFQIRKLWQELFFVALVSFLH